jgi:hypothetical protein
VGKELTDVATVSPLVNKKPKPSLKRLKVATPYRNTGRPRSPPAEIVQPKSHAGSLEAEQNKKGKQYGESKSLSTERSSDEGEFFDRPKTYTPIHHAPPNDVRSSQQPKRSESIITDNSLSTKRSLKRKISDSGSPPKTLWSPNTIQESYSQESAELAVNSMEILSSARPSTSNDDWGEDDIEDIYTMERKEDGEIIVILQCKDESLLTVTQEQSHQKCPQAVVHPFLSSLLIC